MLTQLDHNAEKVSGDLEALYQLEKVQKELAQFAYLIGTWKVVGQPAYETWEWKTGRELVGHGYAMLDGVEVIRERLLIVWLDGEVSYCATVLNHNEGREICFRHNLGLEIEDVFVNPAHDFPKRIVYKRLEEDKILVVLSDEHEKEVRLEMILYP
ncbi:hypothetical protein BFP72_09020 [Reichenbachiella sp. 5M10]|uniref:hypothetical protein n=1 Tax=Reichenbachiella sp. 5M10 TaxID=1889772 RepID=UPI000C145D1F|nr:hypothetical protein [Reichenbachiella sp. 5M10]PIB35521.1 hypothetical protein BFP72_09020 [Reichenbachiella sp. 5M10]